MNDLPPEILSEIFSYLTFSEIVSVKEVSSYWRDVALNPSIWYDIRIIYDHEKTDYKDLIEKVCDHLELVKNVAIRGAESQNDINFLLCLCPKLHILQMVMCRIDNSIVQKINMLNNLTVLHIKNCYMSRDFETNQNWDIAFDSFGNLKNLLLSDFGLSDRNFGGLLSCDKIIHLDIRKIKNLSRENIKRFLEQHKGRLLTLGLYGGESYDDYLMEYVANCAKLRSVSIMRCDNLTDKSLTYLNKINPCKLLLWNNNNFTDNALFRFFSDEKWSNLEYLSFSKIQHITERTLSLLSMKCNKLNFLGLYRCPELCTNDNNLKILFPYTKIFYEG